MVAAAVAAGVAVAATAASTAMQATHGGPDMPSLGGVGSADPREARARRAQFDILNTSRQYADRGAYERNLVTPDLYRAAGYEPEYDEASYGAAEQARTMADAASGRFESARATLDSLTGPQRRQTIKSLKASGLKGKALRQAKKDLRKKTRATRLDLRSSRREMDSASAAAEGAESRAGRITGLKYKGLGTQDEQDFEAALEGRALNAAKTGSSNDPRLNRELDEQEGDIRARLARQFGPDYENTTGGQMALASFRQRAAESRADFARKDIGLADVALGHRRTLGELAGQRMNLALAPSDTRFSTSTQFQNLGVSYENFEKMLQDDRLSQYGAARDKAVVEYQADAARTAAIAGGVQRVGEAASGYGFAVAGSRRAPADNTYPNASGVSTMGRAYDSARGYFGSGQSPYTYGY